MNEETPEERLKKYKENLAKMAQSEGLDTKISNLLKAKTETKEPTKEPEISQVKLEPRSPAARPPAILESPAKRELRESMVVKKKREGLISKLEGKNGRNRILLKARQKAIENQLQEIKTSKSMLELQYKRKVIDRGEYERRMDLLVKEGHNLLKEKAGIDEALAK